MPDNRRAHPRYATSLSLEIYTGEDVILAVAQNLSVGGVGVAALEPLPESGPVGLSMFLVEEGIEDGCSEPIHTRGEVMWCAPSDAGGFVAGIRFVDSPEHHSAAINAYLKRLHGDE